MTIISCSNLEEANNIASTVAVLNHGIACYTLPATRGIDALKRSLSRAAPSITGAIITGVQDEDTLAELLEYDAKNREADKENDLELIITTDIKFLLSKLNTWERSDTIKLITITDL
jgi:hypothetical protein